MARSGFLMIVLITITMGVLLQTASAIRCWQCSSDDILADGVYDTTFCADPFKGNDSEKARVEYYQECIEPATTFQKAVCKKLVQIVRGKRAINRSCFWQGVDAPKDECYNNNAPDYIETEFCETCTTDDCNGATRIGQAALLIALPLTIAKILLL